MPSPWRFLVPGMLARKAARDLGQRKLSIAALAAVIAIGTGIYVGMTSVHRDLDGARERYYRAYRLSHWSVDVKRLPRRELATVRAIENVAAVHGRIVIPVRIELAGARDPITGRAISLSADRSPIIDDLRLVTGRWVRGPDAPEVLVNHAFARENRLAPGDEIAVTLRDRQHRLRVAGTAMSPEFVYLIGGGLAPDPARFGVIYVPERYLERASDLDGAVNQVTGWVHDERAAEVDRALATIETALNRYGVLATQPARLRPSVQFLHDELVGLRVQALVMPSIFLGVAGLVLHLLVGRIVQQQRTALGVLRAIGHTRAAIFRHVLCIGAFLGATGALGGMAIGRAVQELMGSIYRTFYEMPGIAAGVYPDVVLTGAGIGVGCALVGSLSGAVTAARLEPAVAMRPPPPERGGKVVLERIGWLWRRLGFRTRLAARSVLRNPVRSGVSILASAVGTALVGSALTQFLALDRMIEYTFTELSRQDVTLTLRDATDARAAEELSRTSGMLGVEPQLAVACTLIGPGGEYRVGVLGLVARPELFTPLDRAGRRIAIPTRGIVLAQALADKLGARAGDDIVVEPLEGRRVRALVPVMATIETYMGLGAYAEIGYLGRLIGEARVANTYLARTPPGRSPAVLSAFVARRAGIVGVDHRQRALDQIERTIGATLGGFMAVIIGFSGMVGFGSVLNTTLVALSERQREVATLRVLGYDTRQIAWIFSGEILFLGAVGIVCGIGLGMWLSAIIIRAVSTETFRFPLVYSPVRLAIAAATMATFLVLSQLVVYRLIAKLDWREALAAKE